MFHHLPQLHQHALAVSQQLHAEYPLFDTIDKATQNVMINTASLSDFALKVLLQYSSQALAIFQASWLQTQEVIDYQSLLTPLLDKCDSEATFYATIRQFRHIHLMAIACQDLVLRHPISLNLQRQSLLAEAIIIGSLNWLYHQACNKWGTPTNQQGKPMPMLVYGMGKLGGYELNFSSDIDLIFSYPEGGETTGTRRAIDNQVFFTRLAQSLINALDKTTQDGFVYRVDMRLRPFGESGPLVMKFSAMEDYYQEQGRDWERYAMLKARLLGESEYHGQLSQLLRPFVYRRYIDFSVIDSLRRMKLLIAQQVRRKNLTNNIKLGAGGIREIEFIVQVFQLLRGGRVPALQQRSLLTVLPELTKQQIINSTTETSLRKSYLFLRQVENIIQAIDDCQSQTLPDNPLNQERLLAVMQMPDWPSFKTELDHYMQMVHTEFDLLIGEEKGVDERIDSFGLMLWHQTWQEDELSTWLESQRITWEPSSLLILLKQLKNNFIKRSIGQRGQQIIDKLMPRLLTFFAKQQVEITTIERVLSVIDCIATRTTYLELLFENAGALNQLIKLCQQSAWITEYISLYPLILDELLDPSLLSKAPELSSYQQELQQLMLRTQDDLEQQMDSVRQFKHAQQLRIAAADLTGMLPVSEVCNHLTAVAEAIIEQVVHIAWQQVSKKYGVPTDCQQTDNYQFGIIGYGKLGGYELGYGSDLDLVFIHQCEPNSMTTGEKSITATQFYAKLVQRMMHIFNTRMASGVLYELDTRLRPSGNAGLLVTHIDAFEQYQQQDAWTWEHQALVRSRLVFGSHELNKRFQQIRCQVLTQPRTMPELRDDIIAMRQKMRQHLDESTAEYFDIKQGEGGLVDIEFICQFIALAYSHQYSSLIEYSDNRRILHASVQREIISETQGNQLIHAYDELRSLAHKQVLNKASSVIKRAEKPVVCEYVTMCWHQLLNT
jgi:glutamate-ammonia-ligase adenylyltransferase